MDVAFLAVVLAGQPVPLVPRTEPTPPAEVKPTEAPTPPDSQVSDAIAPSANEPDSAARENAAEAAEPTTPTDEVPAEPEQTSEPAPPTVADQPDVVAEPTSSVTEHERAPLQERPRYADEDIDTPSVENPQRRGGFVSMSVGAGHCGTWCSHMAALGGGRIEAGYRWGVVAVGASASLVGGKFDTPASDDSDFYFTSDATGSTRFFHVGPILQFFPVSQGRFDPYASVGVGFRRLVDLADVDGLDGEVKYWESGAGVTLGAGIPIYVTDRIAVGVRYDKSFSIAGKVCATIDGETPNGVDRCEDWSDQTDDLNTVDSRYVRLSRPRPWTVAFEIRFLF